MALDAFVYCDCFEKHNLRSDPPAGLVVKIEPSGEPGCEASDERAWSAFMAWKQTKACLHHGMILLRHRLGTPEQVAERTIPRLARRILAATEARNQTAPVYLEHGQKPEIRAA